MSRGEDLSTTDATIRKTPLTTIIIGIAGSILGLASNTFNLTEALLLIIAISTTVQAIVSYFGGAVQ